MNCKEIMKFQNKIKYFVLVSMMIFSTCSIQAIEKGKYTIENCIDEGVQKYDGNTSESLFLDYQNNPFNQYFYRGKKLVFIREDPSYVRGEQNLSVSEQVFKSIKATKTYRIDFNESKLYPFDFRGTCSAMALDFLARYEKTAAKIKEHSKILSALKNFKPYYRANTDTFCSRQAAFNTIEIKPKYRKTQGQTAEKNKEEKMKSLALYHNIHLSPVTKSLSMPKIKTDPMDFIGIVNKLPFGSYVIRLHFPTDNEKMEIYGHTVCLIKKPSFCLFFDCIRGLEEMTGDIGHEVLHSIMTTVDYIPEIRIYKAIPGVGGPTNISVEKSEN